MSNYVRFGSKAQESMLQTLLNLNLLPEHMISYMQFSYNGIPYNSVKMVYAGVFLKLDKGPLYERCSCYSEHD